MNRPTKKLKTSFHIFCADFGMEIYWMGLNIVYLIINMVYTEAESIIKLTIAFKQCVKLCEWWQFKVSRALSVWAWSSGTMLLKNIVSSHMEDFVWTCFHSSQHISETTADLGRKIKRARGLLWEPVKTEMLSFWVQDTLIEIVQRPPRQFQVILGQQFFLPVCKKKKKCSETLGIH